MALKTFLSVFLCLAFIASPTLVSAKSSNSATIGISVVVPERAEDQKCVIGFESSIDNSFTLLNNTGCQYNSQQLLQIAHQQASSLNTQGFATVIITAP